LAPRRRYDRRADYHRAVEVREGMVAAAKEALGARSPIVAWAFVDLGQRLDELEEQQRAIRAFTQAMGELTTRPAVTPRVISGSMRLE
jgi:hypothetical protein